MLKQKDLFYISDRLSQILLDDSPFGGIVVVLVGDPAQLPPVGGNPLWHNCTRQAHDLNGYLLYRQFTTVVELIENKRLDLSDPDSTIFKIFYRDYMTVRTPKMIGI